jgi:hypothetical protein
VRSLASLLGITFGGGDNTRVTSLWRRLVFVGIGTFVLRELVQ